MSDPYDNASNKVSVLGPTLKFRGELSADEDLLLRGRVEGLINHTASLRIGNEGSVRGNITARQITVEGEVEGDIHGGESVTVKSSATVTGNIYSPAVSLIEGAHFKGTIDMDQASDQTQSPRSPESKDDKSSELTLNAVAGGRK
jgi:cytoskeletal protein CcmA (bactofilin family)